MIVTEPWLPAEIVAAPVDVRFEILIEALLVVRAIVPDAKIEPVPEIAALVLAVDPTVLTTKLPAKLIGPFTVKGPAFVVIFAEPPANAPPPAG